MKRIKLVVVVVLVVAAVAAGSALWMRGSDERLFSALEADQRPSGALERLQDIVDDHPDDLSAQKWLLRLEIETNDLTAAQNRLNLLQVKAPDFYGTRSNACLFYLHKRQGQKAVKNCARAADLSGRSVDDLNRLASAYLLVQDFFKALPTLQEALKKAPNDLKVMNNMGYYFLLVDIPDEAVRFLRQVVDKDPNFLEARKNLAHAYYANKQYPEAAAEIEKILVRDPRNKDLLMIMAIIQYNHFHNKDLARKYTAQAMAAGMDRDRAVKLMQMISGIKPGTVELPKPNVPGLQIMNADEFRRMHSMSNPAPGSTAKPTAAAPSQLRPPNMPTMPATPPLAPPSPAVAPRPAPAPGTTAK